MKCFIRTVNVALSVEETLKTWRHFNKAEKKKESSSFFKAQVKATKGKIKVVLFAWNMISPIISFKKKSFFDFI